MKKLIIKTLIISIISFFIGIQIQTSDEGIDRYDPEGRVRINQFGIRTHDVFFDEGYFNLIGFDYEKKITLLRSSYGDSYWEPVESYSFDILNTYTCDRLYVVITKTPLWIQVNEDFNDFDDFSGLRNNFRIAIYQYLKKYGYEKISISEIMLIRWLN